MAYPCLRRRNVPATLNRNHFSLASPSHSRLRPFSPTHSIQQRNRIFSQSFPISNLQLHEIRFTVPYLTPIKVTDPDTLLQTPSERHYLYLISLASTWFDFGETELIDGEGKQGLGVEEEGREGVGIRADVGGREETECAYLFRERCSVVI